MSEDCSRGVLAFGDSITNGGGELQWGVALQSWALWTARALGLPFTSYARDGARAADLAGEQLDAARRRSANPDSRYDLGCFHIGANDVRSLDWDPERFALDLRAALAFLAGRCDRVVVLTIPEDLGRPRAGARVAAANAAIEAEAGSVGATVVDLRRFRGRRLLMADHVHPTALGQVAIAERMVEAMAAEGLPVFVRPSELVDYDTTWTGRLRGDLTYSYRHLKVSARSLRFHLLSGW